MNLTSYEPPPPPLPPGAPIEDAAALAVGVDMNVVMAKPASAAAIKANQEDAPPEIRRFHFIRSPMENVSLLLYGIYQNAPGHVLVLS